MISGFWKQLKKPIFVIAPMANVTDVAFRRLITKYGKPDVMWTEFVSCDGLMSVGREKLLIDLAYDKSERPIVAQIFGGNPEKFYHTAQLIQELGFDGIDINMGCPDRNVEKQGGGSSLIKNPALAADIIYETKRGAGKLPVSVKTRIGYNKNELATWLSILLAAEPAAITVHARTRKEMSDVPARWEHVAEAVAIRDKYDNSPDKTLILGNGDVKDLTDGMEKIKQTGADGVMIGRGIFGNPWCFKDADAARNGRLVNPEINTEDKLRAMIEHTYLFEKLLSGHKSFDIMKKHFKAYITGFPQAKELRIALMEQAKDAATVEKIVREHFPLL